MCESLCTKTFLNRFFIVANYILFLSYKCNIKRLSHTCFKHIIRNIIGPCYLLCHQRFPKFETPIAPKYECPDNILLYFFYFCFLLSSGTILWVRYCTERIFYSKENNLQDTLRHLSPATYISITKNILKIF